MKNRNIFKVLILSIITLGIYDLFWLYFTRNEMVAKGEKIPRLVVLFAPLLALLAVALLMLISRSSGSGSGNSALNALAILVGIVSLFALPIVGLYWFYHYCKAVEHVTGGHTGFGLSYGLFILFSFLGINFIWPVVIQDAFNKVSHTANNDGSYPHQPQANNEPPYPTFPQ